MLWDFQTPPRTIWGEEYLGDTYYKQWGADWSYRNTIPGAIITRNIGGGLRLLQRRYIQLPETHKQVHIMIPGSAGTSATDPAWIPAAYNPRDGLQTLITTNLQNTILSRMTRTKDEEPGGSKRRTKFNTRSSISFGESLLPLLRTYPSIELSASRHMIGYQAETRGPEILVYR